MVIAYGSRSPLALITIEGGASQKLSYIHNSFTTTEGTNYSLGGPHANDQASKHASDDLDAPEGASVKFQARDEWPFTLEIAAVPVEYMPLIDRVEDEGAHVGASGRTLEGLRGLFHLDDEEFCDRVRKELQGRLSQIRATENRIEIIPGLNPCDRRRAVRDWKSEKISASKSSTNLKLP